MSMPAQEPRPIISALAPFYARHGMRWQTYSGLLYGWLIENRAPHTDWSLSQSTPQRVAETTANARTR